MFRRSHGRPSKGGIHAAQRIAGALLGRDPQASHIITSVTGIGLMIVVGTALILAELAVSGRAWPKVEGWWARAIPLNLVQAGSAYFAARLWDPWMSGARVPLLK